MIRDLCNHIYKTLGPGFSERVYHNAMEVMLRQKGINYETERIVPIVFEGHTIGNVRADIIIDGTLNLPSQVPYHASQMLSKNISKLCPILTQKH